jgi:aryl-alcohol dehydrogenase-like predicted oxidoreductase
VTFFDTAEPYGPFTNEQLVGEALKTNLALVDMIRTFAAPKDATPAQIALAWLVAQKPWIVPIPGMNSVKHMDENLASADVVLTQDDLREIDAAASKITVQGERLAEGLLSLSECTMETHGVTT